MKQIPTVLLLIPWVAMAQDYQHGHNALQIFDAQGMDNTPRPVMIWISFMGLAFSAGLFFVRRHVIARWVVGCFVAGIVFAMGIAPIVGILPLSGFIALCHLVFWSPALYLLLKERPFIGQQTPYAIWSGVMTAVILLSFVFDIRDAYIYLTHSFG